jgi:putative flippase GtrA
MLRHLIDKLKPFYDKLVNRETIAYIIAGVLTTAVNYFSYVLFCNILGLANLVANSIAWIIAVIFAYIINDLWVFQSKSTQKGNQIKKISKFISTRIATFIVEQAGMLLLIDILGFNNLIVKAFLAVVVTILNYICSKMFIFIQK